MTAQFARPPQRGRTGLGMAAHEPHAALLIDFDNVTMGIRSDLTKELKNLLNSDIIKGKVAVQRAYADWRRYPQYIVPLAESSVDLIFAPAYGSAKKNATDIRLAIDAIELVFTRPEIGTIILLSGDSDFSSMVLKLKEYGKYVIGVGIRESASDLLVQNCDEYYSYSALTGLTRADDEPPVVSEDPWELVEMALRQMTDNDDVMRSDRLKQVLLDLDPSFDEKALGFQKFNKFLQEAASRGLLSLTKQDNGQFEIGPPDLTAGAEPQVETRGETRRGRGRRGRGRRDEGRREREEGRERVEERRDQAVAAAPPVAAVPVAAAPVTRVEPAPTVERAKEAPKPPLEPAKVTAEPVRIAAAPAGDAARVAAEPPKPEPVRVRAEPVPAPAAKQPPAEIAAPAVAIGAAKVEPRQRAGADLAASYDLLRRAASELVRKSGQAARDSDVKRRMLELEAGWDESALGFSKFSRFLRQAHDAEVITLRKGENGIYDVLPGNGETAVVDEPRQERGGRDRGRGRGRGSERQREARSDAAAPAAPHGDPLREIAAKPAAEPHAAPETTVTPPVPRERAVEPSAARREPTSPPPAPPAVTRAITAQPQGVPQKPPPTLMFRRGSTRGRGAGASAGPPPLLEGQTAAVRIPPAKPPAAMTSPVPAPAAAAPRPAAPAAAARATRPAVQQSLAARMGLPQEAGEIVSYIATNYRGVGPKTVQALIEKFGPAGIFDALENRPDDVREFMGAARGDRLVTAFQEDIRKRRGASAAVSAPVERPARTRGGSGRGGSRGPGAARPVKPPVAADVGATAATAPAKSAMTTTPPVTTAAAAKRAARAPASRPAGAPARRAAAKPAAADSAPAAAAASEPSRATSPAAKTSVRSRGGRGRGGSGREGSTTK